MIYLIESPAMKLSSEGEKIYYSIYKVGYASNLETRFNQYKSANPYCCLIDKKEGSLEDEQILHYVLRGLGLSIEILSEWYVYDDKVREIFSLSMEELKKMLWENRDEYFPEGIFTNTHGGEKKEFRSIGHKIFSELYNYFVKEDEFEFYGYEYYVDDSNNPVKNENFQNIDSQYLELTLREETLRDSSNKESASPDSSESKIVSEFLEKEFYSTKNFSRRMKSYCKFKDSYKDNSVVIEELDGRISDKKYFRYYSYYGSKGCGSRNYRENELLAGLKSDLEREKGLPKEIYSTFKVGERYSILEIKEILRIMFTNLCITDRKPKATILLDYFEMSKTNITLPDKTVVKGYKILRKKEG